jgi:hypothetical protein
MQVEARYARAASITLMLLLALAAVVVRWHASEGTYVHPDEQMPEHVVGRILAEGTLDTDWGRSAVSPIFRYNQFNFSSYHLALAAVEYLSGHRQQDLADPAALRAHARKLSCLLSGLIVVLAGLLAWRLGADLLAAPVAALLTAASVALFQDAIYARPETFVTTLTLLLALLLTARRLPPGAMLGLSGLILGILLASKVSFALLLPFPPMVVATRVLPDRTGAVRPWHFHAALAAYLGCCVAGFAIGAPYAVAAPWQYLEGVSRLMHEYSDGYGPHGFPEGSLVQRLGYALRYLDYTLGWPVLLLAAGGLAALLRRRDAIACLTVAGPLLMLLYFSQTHAFFERNFSHVLPVVFALGGIAVAILARAVARRLPAPAMVAAAVASVAALVLARPSLAHSRTLYELTTGALDSPKRILAEQARVTHGGNVDVVDVGYGQPIENPHDGLCRPLVYKVVDYGDPHTADRVRARLAEGWRRLGVVDSPFHGSPTSTLWTYHAATIVFLEQPGRLDDAACDAALIPLVDDARLVAPEVPITHDAAWTRDGFPSDAQAPGWRFPLFASWSNNDAGTGAIAIGPFAACGPVTLPYITGPETAHLRLHIERLGAGRSDVVYDGRGPTMLHWSALRLGSADACASWLVRAADEGTGWGQWIGLGAPATLPGAATVTASAQRARDSDGR